MSLRLLVLFLAATLPAAAFADEVSVKRGMEARFGGLNVNSVAKTPYLGLYEVVIGDEIVYTDEKVNYIFNGSVIDARTRRNLTEDRQQKLSAIKFEDLPLELAIKQVRGNGKRVVAIFSDPNCPYCKSLDRALLSESDITIYTFLYPILRPDSTEKSRAIWCSPDRAKAYIDLMLSGREPAPVADCSAPVDRWLALGRKAGVKATPTSFTTKGQRILGARLEELVKLMAEAAK
jgi:thiol:disulfide interchange protein DsbC